MARRLIALLAFATACGPKSSPTSPLAPSPPPARPAPVSDVLIPPRPTLRLPNNFVVTGNAVRLAIDPSKPGFRGAIEITGTITQKSGTIWLHARDLAIAKAVASGPAGAIELTATRHDKDELLELRPATPLVVGTWTIAIEYTGTLDTSNTAGAFKQTVAGDTYVYSQLEALYARRVFPCVDEPDSKVPWQLTLEVPKQLVAVSNTPGVETITGDTKRVVFERTKPLPSYLVAFGVGPFEIVDAGKTKRGTPVRILTLARRAAEGAWAAKTSVPLLEALEDWFGIPYPYEKLDMLTIPLTVGFGAMENAGLITYAETLILLDAKASKDREHDWVNVATHEMAHQWFGNLVTMQYWEDIWLNEGFASWMVSKVTARIDPTYRDELGDLGQRFTALAADALVSARRIRQPIESPDDIATAFDSITYQKGASVLNMFERYVGAAKFQQGVRAYLQARAYGNATSKDFVAAIAQAADNPEIEAAFSTFLDRAGAPEVTYELACAAGATQLRLTQQRYLPLGAPRPAAQGPWTIPMCFVVEQQGKRTEVCKLLSANQQTVNLEVARCPRWVMPNVDGRSYFRAAYTTPQLTALRDEAWDQLTWNERRAVFFDVTSGFANGKVPLPLALSFVPKLLVGNDRFTTSPALGFANELEWLVPDDLRGKYEQWLRAAFGAAATAAGFEAKATDTLDLEATRSELISTVGWKGRDPALVAEAVRLAARHRELPEAIRGLVLRIAVDAKPELFEQLRKELYTEPDRTRRREYVAALGDARDPALHAKALALTLDPKLDIRETSSLFGSGSTEANREAGRAFFIKHSATVLPRMPRDGTAGQVSGLAWVFVGSCKADKRDDVIAYIKRTFEPLPGGLRTVKQATEAMDTCIARRKVLENEVRAWLAGLKFAKPAVAKPAPAKPTPKPRPRRSGSRSSP